MSDSKSSSSSGSTDLNKCSADCLRGPASSFCSCSPPCKRIPQCATPSSVDTIRLSHLPPSERLAYKQTMGWRDAALQATNLRSVAEFRAAQRAKREYRRINGALPGRRAAAWDNLPKSSSGSRARWDSLSAALLRERRFPCVKRVGRKKMTEPVEDVDLLQKLDTGDEPL